MDIVKISYDRQNKNWYTRWDILIESLVASSSDTIQKKTKHRKQVIAGRLRSRPDEKETENGKVRHRIAQRS